MDSRKQPSKNAEKFRELRERAGHELRGFARLLGWKSHTRVQYYEKYPEEFLPLRIVKLFEPHLTGLGVPPIEAREVYALAGANPPTDSQIEPPNVSRFIDSPVALPQLGHRLPIDVPVLGSPVLDGAAGDFTMNGDAVSFAPRPIGLAHRQDVASCWTEGTTMVPWRKPRELVYFEKNRSPEPGDHVVVEMKSTSASGRRSAYLKLWVSETAKTIRLGQYKPAKEFDLEKKDILRIYRVMEWPEVLSTGG